jgi:AcrR family transcriptional regulator
MPPDAPTHLKPRKRPVQARAAATLDAVFEAAIQVLVAEGSHRLTTTHVAQRAGVSVGTMYQYFPHKQALIYALNERYLDVLAERVETTCRANAGAPIERMVEAVVMTYWAVKTERPEVTRALYRSVVELDTETLIGQFAARMDAATAAMLATAPGPPFKDPATVTLTLLTIIFGTIRSVFERNLSSEQGRAVLSQLIAMCVALLKMASTTPPDEIGAAGTRMMLEDAA